MTTVFVFNGPFLTYLKIYDLVLSKYLTTRKNQFNSYCTYFKKIVLTTKLFKRNKLNCRQNTRVEMSTNQIPILQLKFRDV